MATTEHPSGTQPSPIGPLPPTIALRAPGAPPPFGYTPTWADDDVPATAEAVPGATSAVLMTLGSFWPFIVILAALSVIVPFLGGLILVGLAGAVLVLPYELLRRWHSRRGYDRP